VPLATWAASAALQCCRDLGPIPGEVVRCRQWQTDLAFVAGAVTIGVVLAPAVLAVGRERTQLRSPRALEVTSNTRELASTFVWFSALRRDYVSIFRPF